MNCEIIGDLLPLYADACCSEESRRAVQEHLARCSACRESLQAMQTPLPVQVEKTAQPTQIQLWKASVLQSALLFAAFGIITVGVALEAQTPAGLLNGFWAFTLVVPATGFLLSLANWYFVRLYPSRRAFAWGCCIATVAATLLCGAWSLLHYGVLWQWQWSFLVPLLRLYAPGILLAAVLWLLSGPLAKCYGRYLGKE